MLAVTFALASRRVECRTGDPTGTAVGRWHTPRSRARCTEADGARQARRPLRSRALARLRHERSASYSLARMDAEIDRSGQRRADRRGVCRHRGVRFGRDGEALRANPEQPPTRRLSALSATVRMSGRRASKTPRSESSGFWPAGRPRRRRVVDSLDPCRRERLGQGRHSALSSGPRMAPGPKSAHEQPGHPLIRVLLKARVFCVSA